jgi:hypothetical protein
LPLGFLLRNLGKIPDSKDKRQDFCLVWHALGEKILGWVGGGSEQLAEKREINK